jgi:gas vesicle protein
MKLRKERILTNILLGTGVYLLDSLRDRLSEGASDLSDRARDHYDDLRERSQDVYETASDRVGRASRVLRGDDRSALSSTAAVLLGIGVGVGVGMLLAPDSGEETRKNIANKFREMRSETKASATGTYGA